MSSGRERTAGPRSQNRLDHLLPAIADSVRNDEWRNLVRAYVIRFIVATIATGLLLIAIFDWGSVTEPVSKLFFNFDQGETSSGAVTWARVTLALIGLALLLLWRGIWMDVMVAVVVGIAIAATIDHREAVQATVMKPAAPEPELAPVNRETDTRIAIPNEKLATPRESVDRDGPVLVIAVIEIHNSDEELVRTEEQSYQGTVRQALVADEPLTDDVLIDVRRGLKGAEVAPVLADLAAASTIYLLPDGG